MALAKVKNVNLINRWERKAQPTPSAEGRSLGWVCGVTGRRSARGVGGCAIAGEASAQGGSRATELVLLLLLLTD